MTYTYALISLCIAFQIGLCKGICDTLQFHFSVSPFAKYNPLFWNPALSWKNKYKDYDAGDTRPKFLYATTFFVALTDGWHLFQFFKNTLIPILSILTGLFLQSSGLLDSTELWHFVAVFSALRVAMQVGFYTFYRDKPKVKQS